MKTVGLAVLVMLLATACAADGNNRGGDAAAPDAAAPDRVAEAGSDPDAPPAPGDVDAADQASPPDPSDVAGSDGGAETSDAAETEAPGCRTTSPAELALCVSAEDYAADLAALAHERPAWSVGLEAARTRCEQALQAAGFQVERQAFGDGENVIGVLPGTTRADERVLVSAHVDHIEGCPGADDNASGAAAVLEAARVLSLAAWERTLVVACWDGEELGLLGSAAYAERARDRGEDLVAVYVLDMIGYVDASPGAQQMPPEIQLLAPAAYKEVQQGGAKGDFLVILADPAHLKAANLFAAAATETGSKTYVLKIPDALKLSDEAASLRNSDHAAFWEAGFSALAVSDTGPLRNPYLHCAGGQDSVATLDVAFAVGAVRGLVASTAGMLILREAHPAQ